MQDWIRLFENAIDHSTCKQLISIYESSGNKAFTRVGAAAERSHIRRGQKVALTPENAGELLAKISSTILQCYQKYSEEYVVLTKQQAMIEGMAVYKYSDSSDYYGWHADAADPTLRYRFVSIVAYLNDVESGGETEFMYLDRKVQPKEGTIVLFPAGWTHYHQALPPLSGSKYVLITWLRYSVMPPL